MFPMRVVIPKIDISKQILENKQGPEMFNEARPGRATKWLHERDL